VESRQSLKLTSGVRFAPSQPQPGRGVPSGPGRTLLSDSRCRWFESIPGCHFSQCFKRVSFKGQDRTLRTFRLPFKSAYPYQSGLRPIGRGRSAPNAEIPVRIRGAGPSFVGHRRKPPWRAGNPARSRLSAGSGRLKRRQRPRLAALQAFSLSLVARRAMRTGWYPARRLPIGAKRWWPIGKAPDCLSGPEGFDSLPSRQFFHGVEHDRTSALTFNQAIVGPAYPTGCEAHQDEQAALNRQAERSIRSAPTRFVLG
jgi:hypothetical protein